MRPSEPVPILGDACVKSSSEAVKGLKYGLVRMCVDVKDGVDMCVIRGIGPGHQHQADGGQINRLKSQIFSSCTGEKK